MSQYTKVVDSLGEINQLVIDIGRTLTAAKKDMSENQYEYLCTQTTMHFGIDPATAIHVFAASEQTD